MVRFRNLLLDDDDADEDNGALHDLDDPQSGTTSGPHDLAGKIIQPGETT